MLIIFPLNFLLVFSGQPGLFQEEEYLAEEIAGAAEEGGGAVEGAEEKKENEIFPKISSLPVKNEQVPDLAIPNAHASLILDAGSGTILHYNNGKERRPVASLTKLMTAVVVLEEMEDLEEAVTIDAEAVYIEGTKIGCPRSGYCISQRLKIGEKISVRNLLKAMLMNSANDAAIALAKHIGGSEEEFVKKMNQRAKELGLNDTNFCTSSGLEINGAEAECYSTAYDIARVAAYSMKYDLVWEIMRLPSNTTVYSTDGTVSHQLLNTDLVLDEIPNCLGGKTGFTPAAGHSLLMAAGDPTGKHKIIAVVLDNPYRWRDIRTMVDWAWEAHDWR